MSPRPHPNRHARRMGADCGHITDLDAALQDITCAVLLVCEIYVNFFMKPSLVGGVLRIVGRMLTNDPMSGGVGML